MKTLQEKIKVMQGFANGRKMEACALSHDRMEPLTWTEAKFEPSWDWSRFDYRLVPENVLVEWTLETLPHETIWLSRFHFSELVTSASPTGLTFGCGAYKDYRASYKILLDEYLWSPNATGPWNKCGNKITK